MSIKFNLNLPRGITCTGIKFDLCIQNEDLMAIAAEVTNDGRGAYIRLTIPEDMAFAPDELRTLTEAFCEACKAIDTQTEDENAQ